MLAGVPGVLRTDGSTKDSDTPGIHNIWYQPTLLHVCTASGYNQYTFKALMFWHEKNTLQSLMEWNNYIALVTVIYTLACVFYRWKSKYNSIPLDLEEGRVGGWFPPSEKLKTNTTIKAVQL